VIRDRGHGDRSVSNVQWFGRLTMTGSIFRSS
jgi:hypothetical protein